VTWEVTATDTNAAGGPVTQRGGHQSDAGFDPGGAVDENRNHGSRHHGGSPELLFVARLGLFFDLTGMKRRKNLPIPQNEFGFTRGTFNLFRERTTDGERVVREREQAARERQLAENAQPAWFQTKR
jgi:hypothetical protein